MTSTPKYISPYSSIITPNSYSLLILQSFPLIPTVETKIFILGVSLRCKSCIKLLFTKHHPYGIQTSDAVSRQACCIAEKKLPEPLRQKGVGWQRKRAVVCYHLSCNTPKLQMRAASLCFLHPKHTCRYSSSRFTFCFAEHNTLTARSTNPLTFQYLRYASRTTPGDGPLAEL